MQNERDQLIKRIKLQLPDVSELLEEIGSIVIEYPREDGKRKRIEKHVQDQLDEISRNRKLTNDERFRKFVFNCLYVQVTDAVASRTLDALEQRYKTCDVDSFVKVSSRELASLMKESGYRFWSTRSKTLMNIAKYLKDHFNGNMNEYFSYLKNNYEEDGLLSEHVGVSYKSRDWALSQFSPEYALVDVHVRNALRSTGLILYSYLYGIPLSTDRTTTEEYKHIRDLVSKLAESLSWKPFKVVQYLWFFGREYCSKKNMCNRCKTKNCLSRLA